MNYTVREATSGDIPVLAKLRWEFRQEEQDLQDEAEFLQACETWLRDAFTSGRWTIAIAETGTGSFPGCMYLQYVEKVPVPGGITRAWGYLTNSFVAAAYRGKGVGGKLLDLLVETARDRDLEFLVVWPSREGVAFYERAGFRAVHEVHSALDDEPPLELML